MLVEIFRMHFDVTILIAQPDFRGSRLILNLATVLTQPVDRLLRNDATHQHKARAWITRRHAVDGAAHHSAAIVALGR